MRTFPSGRPAYRIDGCEDQREIQTIALALDSINRSAISEAVDELRQRILAMQIAKGSKDGSWTNGESIELIQPTGTRVVPAAILALIG
jgi:hypothetical protein